MKPCGLMPPVTMQVMTLLLWRRCDVSFAVAFSHLCDVAPGIENWWSMIMFCIIEFWFTIVKKFLCLAQYFSYIHTIIFLSSLSDTFKFMQSFECISHCFVLLLFLLLTLPVISQTTYPLEYPSFLHQINYWISCHAGRRCLRYYGDSCKSLQNTSNVLSIDDGPLTLLWGDRLIVRRVFAMYHLASHVIWLTCLNGGT